jgi:pimeloyl-ACP methyl ester carboxylesterase
MSAFLPAEFKNLTEPASITFAQQIERHPIVTSLSPLPIETSLIRQGAGRTPILLLHGFDSSIFEFRRLFPLLTENHVIFAVDLLGFGFTDRPENCPISPATIKTHLYYFWKTFIEQPVILIGVSMGGAAAIDFTLSYPELIERLVLIDSAGFTNGPAIGKYLFPPLGYFATEFLRNPKVRQKISQNAYCDPTFASIDAALCAGLHLKMPRWNQALISFTKSGGYPSFRRHLHKINQPTLILWGKQDRILGIQDATQFHQALPNSQLIWIDNCGHVPHLEQPQITAQHILEFIDT